MDTRFGKWNVRILSREEPLTKVAGEIAIHNLDLVGLKKVRQDRDGQRKLKK
jgi:hypothetical protein